MNPVTESAAGTPLAGASMPVRDIPEGREITLGDSPAIEIHVLVNRKIVRAVLSDASFDKSRFSQSAYAQGLGGRLATQGENLAVADSLLEKEEKGALNPAEEKLLKVYREKEVRDSHNALDIYGNDVCDPTFLHDDNSPTIGALFVFPLAEPTAVTTLAEASLTTNTLEDEIKAKAEQVIKDLEVFLITYKIRAIDGEPSQVALTIPTDKTYADFLREGQHLSIALHAAFPKSYEAYQAIWPEFFEKLLEDPAFQANGNGLETITDGCVSGTNNMNREGATRKLANQGLQHETDHVLVVAHMGRYLLDATTIFQGQAVRAAGGAFCFLDDGMHPSLVSDLGRSNVYWSARLVA